MTTQTTFKPGDVLRYRALEHHCHEGTAYVNDDGQIIDTFWGPQGDYQSYRPKESELASAEVLFNVGDYDALDRWSKASRGVWETYHPDDRGRITMQHGLQEVLFIRNGAEPDLNTQIENARARVESAEGELRFATSSLERRREELAELEASAVAALTKEEA